MPEAHAVRCPRCGAVYPASQFCPCTTEEERERFRTRMSPPGSGPARTALNRDDDLSWLYESTDALDLIRLDALGDARPRWTYHFTTWEAFKRYVARAETDNEGVNTDWCTAEEWSRASREIIRESARC